MDSDQEVGRCVGCMEQTTDAIKCDCTQDIFACGSCRESGALLRCKECRELEQRTVYPCLDFRGGPEFGTVTGGCLPAAPTGAW